MQLANVRFRYDSQGPDALNGLSVTIPSASVTAILGPNGTGKSTLLHMILGLLSPTSGQLELMERAHSDGARLPRSRLIGLVPQREHIPFNFSLFDYVLLGRAPHLNMLQLPRAVDREAAWDALGAAHLEHLHDRPVNALSGGETQMAMVARALAQGPRMLLLDEPTSHLDLGNKGRVLSLMRRLVQDGMTIVFTTHDPNSAAAFADHVVLMHRGRALDEGKAAAVLTSANLSALYGVSVDVLSVEGRPVILDGNHLSPKGSDRVAV